MADREWIVRVVLFDDDRTEEQLNGIALLVEWLRHAGIANPVDAGGSNKYAFDLHAPREIPKAATFDWAARNAERIASFGFNAAAAPRGK